MKPDLIPFEAAILGVLAEARPLGHEEIPLVDCFGRVLAVPLRSPIDIPSEATSLMDGYAVSSAQVHPGNALRVAFEVPAGTVAPRPLGAGECARIFTGAPLPPGADAVVKQEDVARAGDVVRFAERVAAVEHVRVAGSDAKRGDELIAAGTTLDSGALALAAAVGMTDLSVARRPTVAILPTGSELRPPGSVLTPGQIYESNSIGLAMQAREAGAAAVVLGIAPDEPAAIAERFSGVHADVFVTSGGASVGDFDFARDVLARLGGRKVFWQVAIRPGKPILFGLIERGAARPTLFFALPGNPGASALTFDLLVRPAVRAMLGATPIRRPRVRARLGAPVKKPEGLTFLARGSLVERDQQLLFNPAALQGSMSIPSLKGLGAVAFIPPEVTRLEAGAVVEVEPWRPLDVQ